MTTKKVKGWVLPETDTHFEKYLERDGTYQKHEQKWAFSFDYKKEIFIDIGAHIGCWSVGAVRAGYQGFLAFEPCGLLASCCKANLRNETSLKRMASLYVYEMALGAMRSEKLLKFDPLNTGKSQVYKKRDRESGVLYETIQMHCLDEFTHLFEGDSLKPSMVKIDVQGYESMVLTGGKGFITEYQPLIVLENDEKEKWKYKNEHSFRTPDYILKDYGYKLADEFKREQLWIPN